MRTLNLVSAIILIIIALAALLASDLFYRRWLGNDVFWGKDNWLMTARAEGDRIVVTDFVVTEPGKGHAFFIRTVAVAIPALIGSAFMIAWSRKRRSASSNAASTPTNP